MYKIYMCLGSFIRFGDVLLSATDKNLRKKYIQRDSVTRFFSFSFFVKLLLQASKDKPTNNFYFFWLFTDMFNYFGASPYQRHSWHCLTGAIDTGKWCFYCFRELHRCQRHGWGVPRWGHWHCFTAINNTSKTLQNLLWHEGFESESHFKGQSYTFFLPLVFPSNISPWPVFVS